MENDMYCKKCGKPISDSEKTCLNCGAEIERAYLPKYSLELYYCASCGNEADKTDSFCLRCGTALNFSDIIAESLKRRKEPTPIKGGKWMYIPIYTPKKDGEEDDVPPENAEDMAEETPADEPEAASDNAEQVSDEPEKKEPLEFEGEINIVVTDEETLAEEEARKPVYEEQVPVNEAVDFPQETENESEETASYPDETPAPYIDEAENESDEPEQPAEENSANPDLTLTAPTENADFVPPVERAAEPEPTQNELNVNDGEPVNYSTDEEAKLDKAPDKNAAVNVTRPQTVPEKSALGVVAIILAVLFPPLGIILGVIAVSRGWTTLNKTYVRLGVAAIAVGIAMTIAVCVLSWKVFIPAIENYFKAIE